LFESDPIWQDYADDNSAYNTYYPGMEASLSHSGTDMSEHDLGTEDDDAAGPSTQYQGSPESSESVLMCTVQDCRRFGKIYLDLRTYNKHMKHHIRPVACQVHGCGHKTGDNKDMNRHYWAAHPPWAKRHNIPRDKGGKCDFCGKKFTRSDNLTKHIKKKHT
jgi:hypothetical protein